MNDEEKQTNYDLAEKLFAEQNFSAAIIAGAVATAISAAAFNIVAAKWPFSYGFAIAGIGIVVGISMQFLGRGIATKFSVVATAYTIAAFLLGKFLLRGSANVDAGELIYLFIAIVAAVFLVKRPLSRSDRLAIGLLKMRH